MNGLSCLGLVLVAATFFYLVIAGSAKIERDRERNAKIMRDIVRRRD